MPPQVEYFKEDSDAAEQRRRELRQMTWVTIIVVLYFFIYGTYLFLNGHPEDVPIGTIDFCTGSLLIANFSLLLLHKKPVVTNVVGTLIASISLVAIIPFGGSSGTAIFWSFAFPAAVFVLNGLRRGIVLNGIFCLTIALLSILQQQGVVHTPYPTDTFWQMWWVLSIIIILGGVSQHAWENAREAIIAQRERMRTLLQHLPGGVLMMDRSGKILAANAGMERLLGQRIDPASTLADFPSRYRLEQQSGVPSSLETFPVSVVLAGKAEEAREIVLIGHADATRSAVRITAAPTRNDAGEIIGAVAIFEDVTKEHEIDEMKSELVSLASHQLKTPLTSIKWTSGVLLDGDLGTLAPEQRTAIGEIAAIIDRLMRLVSDLLSVSRIETGKKFDVTQKTTDIIPIVDDTVKELTLTAEHRDITIVSTLPKRLPLYIDGGKIKELLTNIIGNAVKYSKEGGHVEIGLSRTEPDADTLYVKDDGVGIPADQQNRIFERFFRAGNVDKDIEGTGLGMYIAKVIIDRHGGQLWFDSTEGTGTTFFIKLPSTDAGRQKTGV